MRSRRRSNRAAAVRLTDRARQPASHLEISSARTVASSAGPWYRPAPGDSTDMSSPIPSTPPVLRVEGLAKTYRGGRVRALDGVTFEARAGEALGIVGPNGAGKTTLMGCLLGLLRPESGTIRYTEGDQNALAVRASN